jgi:hypothetical protein
MMDEVSFAKLIAEQLGPSFPTLEIETGKSIFYSLYIDENGNIPINKNAKGEPIRGAGAGFEQDILLYERVSGETSVVPRVAVEVKLGGVTTHDAIVYSEKARRLRNVYPYLRYGFLVGDISSLPARLLRLGTDFDFIIRVSNPPLHEEMDQLIELLREEIDTSQKLGMIFSRQVSVQLFRRKIIIKPPIDITHKTTAASTQSSNNPVKTPIESLTGAFYFVYENWVAENKAVIHLGTCSSCNQGKGVHPNSGKDNGRWLGPFPTLESAENAALATGRPVKRCKKCGPC